MASPNVVRVCKTCLTLSEDEGEPCWVCYLQGHTELSTVLLVDGQLFIPAGEDAPNSTSPAGVTNSPAPPLKSPTASARYDIPAEKKTFGSVFPQPVVRKNEGSSFAATAIWVSLKILLATVAVSVISIVIAGFMVISLISAIFTAFFELCNGCGTVLFVIILALLSLIHLAT